MILHTDIIKDAVSMMVNNQINEMAQAVVDLKNLRDNMWKIVRGIERDAGDLNLKIIARQIRMYLPEEGGGT